MRLSLSATRPLLAALAFASAPSAAVPQETPAPPGGDAAVANARLAAEFSVAEAGRYEIRGSGGGPRGGRAEKPLDLVAEPVLVWSNPTGDEVHGAVLLWTRDGRPEAAASIYRFFEREQVNAELVSLSEGPLVAERNGRVRWTPAEGVAFAPVPGAPAPPGSAAGRRLQARAEARRFTGAMAGRNAGDEFANLRLLSRPLYHYEATDGSGRDGAVFAMATANDPELLLVIESRPAAGGRAWHWAAARMAFNRLKVSHAGRTVWEVPQAAPPWDRVRGPEGSYVILEWPSPAAAEGD